MAAGLVALLAATAAPGAAAVAAPVRKPRPISARLTASGFPRVPNTIAWAPGTAYVSTTTAPAGTEITIGGVAPPGTPPGTVLTLRRVRQVGPGGTGAMQDLGITGTVGRDRTFLLLPTLSLVGTWGYAVGYETEGDAPEFIGFQFQISTTKAL